ncbi:two-component sensor histidine kinase [Amycolatopsis taiwanensis]|uniref:histidine kinase n=1 Tax=Amycolatopsis taiwanensis TaxID=342230 RepID=A0A9W6VGY5_9PSEU|nr:two-component sensor histidine kinase [Amycolatopsis taiwanensis]
MLRIIRSKRSLLQQRASWRGPGFRAGIRMRATAVAVVVLATALALAGVAVVVLLGWSLDRAATDSARDSAHQVASQLARQGARDLSDSDVASTGDTSGVTQVLDRTGRPIASDPVISNRPALTTARPGPGREIVETAQLSITDSEDSFRLVSVGVAGPGGPYVVVAARSLNEVEGASFRLTLLLALACVPLLVIAALAVHRAVGSALRPVERMRRTVAEIPARDVTLRVPLPPAQDEVYRLATTLNGMLDRLSSAQEAQRRFVSDASHELRSPLSTITTALEVTSHHPETMSRDELVDIVSREVARLRELVDDLLVLARTDDTTDTPTWKEVDLDDLARAEGERIATSALEVEIRALPAKVRGNPEQLRRAVRNLVDNARDHAHRRVRVATSTVDATAMLEVSDDGPGVPEADRQRIFERFVRLDDSRERRVGGAVGLGLAIVAGIAQRHDGRARYVELADPRYSGANFRLELPIAKDPD